ncbi:MAG: hypothetical protein ACXWOW_04210 [Candidatus Limnocylindrales bacterium]
MVCLAGALLLLGPRVAAVLWWLFDSVRWNAAFSTWVIPALGILFLPWTTLAFVLMNSATGLSLFGVILVALGFIVDIGSYAGGAYTNKDSLSSIYR